MKRIMNTYEKTVKHYFHFYLLNLCKPKILTNNIEDAINLILNRNKTNNFNKYSITTLPKRTFQALNRHPACFACLKIIH